MNQFIHCICIVIKCFFNLSVTLRLPLHYFFARDKDRTGRLPRYPSCLIKYSQYALGHYTHSQLFCTRWLTRTCELYVSENMARAATSNRENGALTCGESYVIQSRLGINLLVGSIRINYAYRLPYDFSPSKQHKPSSVMEINMLLHV